MRALLVGLLLVATAAAQEKEEKSFPNGMNWREIGPYRGGRAAAVAGIASQRDTYYFGACGGGVWKTTNGGKRWRNVSDGFFGGSIGAVAVSEWDPNVVYVGGGEKTLRGNVSHGDGMYKSTDAGRTWKKIGLEDSRHVCRIRVHPKDPDLVYVAALGHLYGPNEQRGVFRSKDGGRSWERILFVNENAGCVDLILDPTNPRIVYATFWRVRRTPWTLESGGEGSGIWKSTDGGDNWTELTKNPGLPKGPLGIAGIAVSPSNPDNVYAMIEAEQGGVYRSRNAGRTWRRTNQDRSLRQRAWYYTRIYADPKDQEACYVLNVGFYRSKDGGRTFSGISVPHGDNHDLWIDPEDPLRMIQSNDGGANVSYDGAKTWSPQDNQPTAQMYRVSVDNDYPYRLLGGQQDNSAIRIRSRATRGFRISERDWESTAGGESGHIVAKPDNPDIVFGGSYGGYLNMVNHDTGERRSVNVWPDNPMGWGAAKLKYRFQWNFPIFFSPHDPDLLYAAAQVLFRSRDGGESWTPISPDLTRNDKSKQGPSGGPITKDNTSVEYYCTIFAALESPHERGVLWAGSDDGLIHVSRDDGKTWINVTPKELPEWAQINSIEAHPFEKGGLYVAATRYKSDDFKPYLYKTTDYGKTWTKITDGIDVLHFTRVIRADPDRRGLLYAGTERGVYWSLDDGASWKPLQQNLPVVPVTDLAVKNQDLVVATQGRGYWLLDDLTPLHQVTDEVLQAPAHLFAPRVIDRVGGRFGSVSIHFLLKEVPKPKTEMRLDILEADGTVIQSYKRRAQSGGQGQAEGAGQRRGGGSARLPAEKGHNRFSWNLSYPGPERVPGMITWNGARGGPRAVPGKYQVRLVVGDWAAAQPVVVRPNPRASAKQEDLLAQFDFAMEVRDKITETHRALKQVKSVRRQLGGLKRALKGKKDLLAMVKDIEKGMKGAEEALYQTKNQSRQDPLNYPIRLNDKLMGVYSHAMRGDFRPTRQLYAVRDELAKAIDKELAKLDEIWSNQLPELNRKVRDAGIDAVVIEKAKEETPAPPAGG